MLLINADVTPRNPVTRRRPSPRELSRYYLGRRWRLDVISELERVGTRWRRRLSEAGIDGIRCY